MTCHKSGSTDVTESGLGKGVTCPLQKASSDCIKIWSGPINWRFKVKSIPTLGCIVAFGSLVCLGQAPGPNFEVASVKPNRLDTRGFIGPTPGRGGFVGFRATNARLAVLVELAYRNYDFKLEWTSDLGKGPGMAPPRTLPVCPSSRLCGDSWG